MILTNDKETEDKRILCDEPSSESCMASFLIILCHTVITILLIDLFFKLTKDRCEDFSSTVA
jgi:hypothetical protein